MLGKLKVLIVDDNAHMIQIVKTILRGFDVKDLYDATSIEEAIDIFRGAKIDMVVTDLAMEPKNGCDLTRWIRGAPESPNSFTPVIMLSAYAERSNVEAARDAGVTEFCAKPVTAQELYRKVAYAINSPRSFVRTGAYFGPDRRRRKTDEYAGDERRDDSA